MKSCCILRRGSDPGRDVMNTILYSNPPLVTLGANEEELKSLNFRQGAIQLTTNVYGNMTSSVYTTNDEIDSIHMRAGVRTLSPILFNLAIVSLLRAVERIVTGYTIAGVKIKALAYPNDLVIIASNPRVLQRMLDALLETARVIHEIYQFVMLAT